MKSEAITSLDWGKINFFLGEVFRNFTRNAGMQVTAIGTVAVTIFLLGTFLFVHQMVARIGNQMLGEITISAYMQHDATAAQDDAVRSALAKDPRVIEAQFIPKKQGLAELAQRMKGQIDVTSFNTENPLPDKFRIRVRDARQVPSVALIVQKIPGVDKVVYGQDVVAQLLRVADFGRRIGLGVIALFVLVAGVIISNTIRLTVFARRREISIMQLVGATNMYIRLPFICEGLLSGVLGAAVAVIVLLAARPSFMHQLTFTPAWIAGTAAEVDLTSLLLELVAAGAAMGIVASWIAVGRYLRT